MRNGTRWGAALTASAALSAVCGGALAQSAAGHWRGTTEYNGAPVAMSVTLKAKAGGRYEGSWAGPRDTLPLQTAKVEKGTLSFTVKDGGSFTGRWDKARKAWVGQWTPRMTVMIVGSGAPGPGAPGPGAKGAGRLAGVAPPSGPIAIPSLPLVLTAGKP